MKNLSAALGATSGTCCLLRSIAIILSYFLNKDNIAKMRLFNHPIDLYDMFLYHFFTG